MHKTDYLSDSRFKGIQVFDNKVWLSSPTMHGDEQMWVDEAIRTNWVSTVGENIDEVEKSVSQLLNGRPCVALSCGTAALHMAIRLAGERLYGRPRDCVTGTLCGRRVFVSDMTFDATVNPVCYEGGECIFIDTDPSDWNMDADALEEAFKFYPEVRLIVFAHLYGVPGNIEKIRAIANEHNALIVEDAAESFGARVSVSINSVCGHLTNGLAWKWVDSGCFGDYSIISFNGNKIITGSAGGMLVTTNQDEADRARKWSTQSREAAPWYQHEELGYNYRMSNIIAGIVRGQLVYLEQHIEQKRKIWDRYKQGLDDLPVSMNPIPGNVEPNYWLSCMIIDEDSMCPQVRSGCEALYYPVAGKSCPTEVLEALAAFNAEGRPIWKPLHLQPVFAMNPYIGRGGSERGSSNAYNKRMKGEDIGLDIFRRGLCLPSDNKMSEEEQNVIIDIIHRCFE